MEAPKLTFLQVKVPVDNYESEDMQIVSGDEEDRYIAKYIPDIVFASFGERDIRINLIKPAHCKGPFPLLVYIQGSGWLPQERYTAIPQLSDFAHHGYVVASVEYRHSLEAKFPAQIQDVKTAIRYLRKHAATYQIDPGRVAVWGDSSGGHLAALTGVSEGVAGFDSDLFPEQPSSVNAVIDFYGPTDILQMSKYPSRIDHDAAGSPESLLIGGPIQQNKEKAALTNPIFYISKEKPLPPFLIMHGDQDEIVPFNQSVLLYESLKEAGHQATFYKVKGAGHGARFWTPKVLDIVRAFLAVHV